MENNMNHVEKRSFSETWGKLLNYTKPFWT